MRSGDKTMDESRQGEALVLEGKGNGKKLFLESYGCAMNFSDSEIIASILAEDGYSTTREEKEADLILINTCSIREKAEERVRNRLTNFKKYKRQNPSLVVGMLGCMAERLKDKLLEEEKLVDLVVGPDAYRDLPNLIQKVEGGQKSVNVLLSREETYAEISPVRLDNSGVTAFISIMRGCDNMCSFCVVPFTRGRERSRDPQSIVAEAQDLYSKGYREVTLLGQNVDSYKWNIDKKGVIKDESKPVVRFAELLEMVAQVHPDLRVRFSTSHPKDMTDDVLHAIAKYENLCKYIHLPVQSGASSMLKRMNRGYTREWYMDRIAAIKRIIPDCELSTDIIAGFCGETEEEHAETLSLLKEVGFIMAYHFKYSERPRTLAERKFEDDIPEDVKSARLAEIISVQRNEALKRTSGLVGRTYKVLVEGPSKKNPEEYCGRTTHNTMVIFPKENAKVGEYVNVKTTDCTSITLFGVITNEEAEA
ncbi:MAG: tRNA (N6-isopentenyl adenosine(37)-C2)-methylthiotransferase MiaB [Euryarchaeota archaeon]|nr:tRNA (N6-isopentenyl adenosine(37)-C2)-methylthiotransferase MiaB [Euryarchaeota archaeon]|tara:strand:- start:51 stop:1487 length:1437 start_codon:yes stop_codon:yes gene_type:complete